MIDRGLSYESALVLGAVGLFVMLIFNIALILKNRQKGPVKTDSLQGFKKFVYLFTRYSFVVVDFALIIFLLYLGYDLLGDPHIVEQNPKADQILTNNRENIFVVFNRPLDETTLKPQIYPEVAGKWEIEPVDKNFPFIKRKLVFYPKLTLPLNQKIFLYYAGIANIYADKEPWEFGIDAFTPSEITKAEVSPVSGTVDMLTDNVSLSFKMDVPAGLYYKWEFKIDPPAESQIAVSSEMVDVNITSRLSQSTKYTYSLVGSSARFDISTGEVAEVLGLPITLSEGTFETVREPLLSSVEPKGNSVIPNAPVSVVFDNEMVQDSLDNIIQLEPGVSGTPSWKDSKSFEFTHDPFSKETDYQLTIKSGLKSQVGGVIEKDFISKFTTIGKVKLVSTEPAGYASGVGIGANLNMHFDQEVDHASAESKFSINPKVDGSFSWNGNTLIFNPNSNLNYSTDYRITFASGVKSIYGIDSVQDFSFSFKTQDELFKLNVPVYYQKLRYSCNLEATRMALAYRGIYKDVLTLHSQIARDYTPYDEVNNTFGDPYTGYTGDIYGKTKGYGVYWGPISNLISKYRSNSIKTGWNLTGLLTEVRNGNPVVIWAHNGYSYAGNEYHWTTPGGKDIRAITGMHSYVVVGYRGSVDNPTHVILNDSNRGVWTKTKNEFLSLWGYFNNTGIVVY